MARNSRSSHQTTRLAKSYYVALRALRTARWFIVSGFFLFAASALISFSFPETFSFFDPLIRELASKIEGFSLVQLIVFIFQNNSLSALFALFLGIGLGIVPLFNSLINGALLGYVLARASSVEGLSIIWRLVPHGIFELPAIFIAIGLGMRLGFFFVAAAPRQELLKRFRDALYVFLYIILPLLVAAALIESVLIYLF